MPPQPPPNPPKNDVGRGRKALTDGCSSLGDVRNPCSCSRGSDRPIEGGQSEGRDRPESQVCRDRATPSATVPVTARAAAHPSRLSTPAKCQPRRPRLKCVSRPHCRHHPAFADGARPRWVPARPLASLLPRRPQMERIPPSSPARLPLAEHRKGGCQHCLSSPPCNRRQDVLLPTIQALQPS